MAPYVIQQECAATAVPGVQHLPPGAVAKEDEMAYLDYMWIDIGNWEFGRMHKELQALGDQGWEVDGVVDDSKNSPASAGGASAVCLRLKRKRKY